MISPDRWPRFATSGLTTGTRQGPLVTASASTHTKGSYVQLVAAAPFDVWMLGVHVTDQAGSGANNNLLLDIGDDPAGGTSYTVNLPDLALGMAGTTAAAPPSERLFPCYIPAGASIAARFQSAVASDTAQVGIVMYGGTPLGVRPKRSPLVAYGVSAATSAGTTLTNDAVGADTKGAWAQLVAATSRDHEGFVVCISGADNAMTANRYLVDIGIGGAGSEIVLFGNLFYAATAAEIGFHMTGQTALIHAPVISGTRIAARAQADITAVQSHVKVAVYGF
jgi:hypothetical protein